MADGMSEIGKMLFEQVAAMGRAQAEAYAAGTPVKQYLDGVEWPARPSKEIRRTERREGESILDHHVRDFAAHSKHQDDYWDAFTAVAENPKNMTSEYLRQRIAAYDAMRSAVSQLPWPTARASVANEPQDIKAMRAELAARDA